MNIIKKNILLLLLLLLLFIIIFLKLDDCIAHATKSRSRNYQSPINPENTNIMHAELMITHAFCLAF